MKWLAELIQQQACQGGRHVVALVTTGEAFGLPPRDQCAWCGEWWPLSDGGAEVFTFEDADQAFTGCMFALPGVTPRPAYTNPALASALASGGKSTTLQP